jgi:hypothetical protein
MIAPTEDREAWMSNHHTDAAPAVAKRELSQFLRMAEDVGLDTERQRRWLHMSADDWQRWVGILSDAPLPSHPALPLLLRRLGYLNNRLDRARG